MEGLRFDRFVRQLTMDSAVSRRSVFRRAASSALASPLALLGVEAAAADGKDDKAKNKDKKGDQKDNQGRAVGAGDRDVGHPCAGNQECRSGLYCWATGPGSVARCTTEPPPASVETNQTVVQTNNQVCAGDCDQTNEQTVSAPTTQTVLVENQEFFGRPSSYWVDVTCSYEAPRYRTVCNCVAQGEPGAPRVRKISLPKADICAYVIDEVARPEERERVREVTNESAGGGEANAGTGGVANADASGGSVTIGDVRGDNDIAIDASGGTANADASGGDNNVAIAGGNRTVETVAERIVEPSLLTLTLEGNVVPGKTTTYWVDTEQGRRPATGPALVQVADEPDDTGAIIAEARICDITQPQQGFDWFGQCNTPAVDMQFSLYPESGDSGPLATMQTNAQGRARFGALPAGTYQLQPEGTVWCYAESDRVDANGNVLVETGVESHVWSFICGAPRGS
jgi:hypothetical protein